MIACIQIGTTFVQGSCHVHTRRDFQTGKETQNGQATVRVYGRTFTGRLITSHRTGSTTVLQRAHNAEIAGSNPAPSTRYGNHHDEIAAIVAEQEATNG